MLKKIFSYFLILFNLWLPTPQATATDLMIRAQDDTTIQGLKLTLKISPSLPLQEGPSGYGIEVISNGPRAFKDAQGNFMSYNCYRDARGRIIVNPQQPSLYRFLFSKPVDQMPFFDDVSAFGTVGVVFNMYEKDLQSLTGYDRFQQRWNTRGTVKIYPHTTKEQFKNLYPRKNYDNYYQNAFYDNHPTAGHVLCFFPMRDQENQYTSQSFDVVAHEAGHNVLNILRPDVRNSPNSDRRAFHESFGDMTAIFAALTFRQLREKVLQETGDDLHKPSFLSVVGERIANRDAAQATHLSFHPSCEAHRLSERLTKALYGILADYYDLSRISLEEVSVSFRRLFFKTILNSNLSTFIDFGRSLKENTSSLVFQKLIFENFAKQGIDLRKIPQTLQVCIPETHPVKAAKCSTIQMSRKTLLN